MDLMEGPSESFVSGGVVCLKDKSRTRLGDISGWAAKSGVGCSLEIARLPLSSLVLDIELSAVFRL